MKTEVASAGKQHQPELSSLPGAKPGACAPQTLSSIHQLPSIAGNQIFGRWIQAKLEIGRPADVYEQEADRVADQIVRTPDPAAPAAAQLNGVMSISRLQRKCAQCEEEEVQRQPMDEEEEEASLQSKEVPGHTPQVTPAVQNQIDGLRGGGQPLPESARAFFEPRFGQDFSHVRIHTGAQAAESARATNARAFAVGSNVFFGSGQYAPETEAGQRLLAHELVHTIQQGAANNSHDFQGRIQRQEEGSQPTTPPITAQTIFPFPRGSRVVLNRILSEALFGILSSQAPQIGDMVQAIEGQVATVTTASDDLFEATSSSALNLPAQDGRPATTITNLTLSLRRQPAGTFDLTLSGQTDPPMNPPFGFEQRDMTASREDGRIVLSSGSGANAVPQLRISPGGPTGQTRIEAYTAPYLDQVPPRLRGFIPERIDLIQITRLPDVPAGTAAEQQAVRNITSQVASRRSTPRQRLLVGGGIQSGAAIDPLLAASWQINFTPIETAPIFQVPLEVQLQYAPTSSVLGQVSTGAELSLAPLNIPVNIRILSLGVAGGSILGNAPEVGADRPTLPAFGPTLGTGAGVELGAFRADIRYEHLFNLIESSPNADSVFGRVGVAF